MSHTHAIHLHANDVTQRVEVDEMHVHLARHDERLKNIETQMAAAWKILDRIGGMSASLKILLWFVGVGVTATVSLLGYLVLHYLRAA